MFFKQIHYRIKITLLIIILLFLVIIGKVFYIQVFSYKKINKYANNLWSRNLPIASDRGKIYDRNGIVLADNETTVSLVIIPNQVKNKEHPDTRFACRGTRLAERRGFEPLVR